MGEVYLAEDTRLRRQVAIKALPPEMASDPERLERFAREAMAVAALNHPNIVTLYGIEEVDGLRFLIMERVEGKTLRESIPPGGVDRKTFFQLAVPLADALAAAHEKGVTHRDLKPANIMVTPEGRVKIVDFGIAKLRQDVAAPEQTLALGQPDPTAVSPTPSLTRAGQVIGTFPYMSPEQLKGRSVDPRSDLFSLGVILYEIATGARPFIGETAADLISSILRDAPPSLTDVRAGELPHGLGQLVNRCLEKDPEQRFQKAQDVRDALASLEDEMRSQEIRANHTDRLSETLLDDSDSWESWDDARPRPSLGQRLRRHPLSLAAAGAVLLLLAALGLYRGFSAGGPFAATSRPGPEPDARRGISPGGSASPGAEAEPGASPGRASLAVLHFSNTRQDEHLAWLVTGLTDMMVTNLSQSPRLRVLSTDRLYEILRDLDQLDTPRLTPEVVRQVAREAAVDWVVKGTFVQVGATLQINIEVEEVGRGGDPFRTVARGEGEESIFTLVDGLSREIREHFAGSPAAAMPELERDVAELTTTSVPAYRLYSEGMNLRWQLKLEEAIPLFEEAVKIDPGFALAHARLVSIFDSLGRAAEAEEAARRAFEGADRLPPAERFYIEGEYYGRRRETYGRAIEAYSQALDLAPDHGWAHYGIAHLYAYLELFDEAIEHYGALLPRARVYPATYHSLANMYAAKGQFEKGAEYVESLVRQQPESWLAHVVYGWHLIQWGKLPEALAAYDRGEALRPGSPFLALGRYRAWRLLGNGPRAEAEARKMLAVDDPYWHWQGAVDLAALRLAEGQGQEAREWLREAIDSHAGGADPLTAAARCRLADLLLATGEPAAALEQAEAARREAPGEWPEWEGLFWSALATEALGRHAEADALAAEVTSRGELLPGHVEERLALHLAGRLALDRGDAQGARRALGEAVALLPPRGIYWQRQRLPDHTPLKAAEAEALARAGDRPGAIRAFRAVSESTLERIWHPVDHVRSFYRLGQLLAEEGDEAGAREAWQHFVDAWGQGDLDRAEVAAARRKLAAP